MTVMLLIAEKQDSHNKVRESLQQLFLHLLIVFPTGSRTPRQY